MVVINDKNTAAMDKAKNTNKPVKLEKWKSSADKSTPPPFSPLPENERIGYAVVGLGHLALEEVIPALFNCKFSRLAALVSGDNKKMEKVALQYGISPSCCYTYECFDELRDNPDVKVIYIILPNSMHMEFTIRGARAGKHILCEKPMANSSTECRKMITACNKAKVKLMIAYRMHFQPHTLKLKEMVSKNRFGEVRYIEAANGQSSANPEHWRHQAKLAGGGALPDIGIYCLNTIRFILQKEPTEVFAYQYSTPEDPLFKDTEELISWQMKFREGLIASCMAHYKVREIKTLRIHAERGWMFMDRAFAYKGQQLSTSRADGEEEIEEKISLSEPNQFAAEMDHFSQCILTKRAPNTPGEEGLRDQIIMEAIYKSANTGKPVRIKDYKY
ncbi:Gfo/Idh/MocA family protein [Pedobacter kyonggii]|uniref:Gfo/Idh/MocA family oxidoreductase n=1 Tax=Pedobacter kyonggii TaxID=1926871 RepID=A0A4Q9H5P4_9SPHI|nr:Gfo/Idh/MocA family oxidoreductase [Pedobacter kyonggii]TBO36405.1 Gfo/Idh/MocA family oxidoreductase [Pedobacter kyonggii]